jgi:hypothetical protein
MDSTYIVTNSIGPLWSPERRNSNETEFALDFDNAVIYGSKTDENRITFSAITMIKYVPTIFVISMILSMGK